MLGPGRYLLGTAEIILLASFAWLGAARVRSRLLPTLQGAPAHLATAVLAAALLIWPAELLGTASLLQPLPYVLAVVALGLGLRMGLAPHAAGPGASPAGGAVGGTAPEEALATGGGGGSPRATGPAGEAPGPRAPGPSPVPTTAAVLIAAIALAHFAWEAKSKLSTGMTGFDSTWYHAPFAAGFLQSGDTLDLHFIAPQFLAWFYPANAEIFHAAGMLAFERDILSLLLNIGWFLGCLLACWCIGRPYGVAPWSLALGAVALSVPALADQAGEARNDIVGIFFLLAAVAIALNAWPGARSEQRAGRGEGGEGAGPGQRPGWPAGALAAIGLAAGLAAGTKLNFLAPAAVLVGGLAVLSPPGRRLRALGVATLAALAGGGYWYLRNLVHSGNPLPWIEHLGPIDLPAPDQALGGREAHSVASYLFDGAVWSDWLLPGLHDGLWILWPLLLTLAFAGLALSLQPRPRRGAPAAGGAVGGTAPEEASATAGGGGSPAATGPAAGAPRLTPLAVAGLAGLASALAWLIAPTSASGPEGMPRGFESGLRYLAPALVLGLALLPATPAVRRLPFVRMPYSPHSGNNRDLRARWGELHSHLGRGGLALGAAVLLLLAIAIGYPVQRHYLDRRYADPSFTAPGLDAAFAWARDVSGARIATTSTRQYPLFGTDLSNRVEFIGEETPHGGFQAPTTCRAFRRLLAAGDYDYVIASRDRLEPGKPTYPPEARWTAGPWARVVLEQPPTIVYQLIGPPDPSACP